MLQKVKVTAFTVSELLRENQQEGGEYVKYDHVKEVAFES